MIVVTVVNEALGLIAIDTVLLSLLELEFEPSALVVLVVAVAFVPLL